MLTAQPASFQIASPTSFVNQSILVCWYWKTPHQQRPSSGHLHVSTQKTQECSTSTTASTERAKKLFCTLIPEAYFWSFNNNYTGYANVQCLKILSHLWSTYGVLQDYEVQENDVKMKKAISAETLFEEFVEQIETAVDAVATQVPYTRHKIVSISFTIEENAGK